MKTKLIAQIIVTAILTFIAGCSTSDSPKSSILSGSDAAKYATAPSQISEFPNFGGTIHNTGVIRAVRGSAMLSSDNGKSWAPARVGARLKAYFVVRTAADGQVDVFLGENGPVVRVRENAVLAINALDLQNTGIEKVIDTQLDLRQGQILGSVKKLAAQSRYQVTFPGGKAECRGEFSINSAGQVNVVSGTTTVTYRASDTGIEMPPVMVGTGQQANPGSPNGSGPTVTSMSASTLSVVAQEVTTVMVGVTTASNGTIFVTIPGGATIVENYAVSSGGATTTGSSGGNSHDSFGARGFDNQPRYPSRESGSTRSFSKSPKSPTFTPKPASSATETGRADYGKPMTSAYAGGAANGQWNQRDQGKSKQSRMQYSQVEELWVISRPVAAADAGVVDDQYPGTGALVTRVKEREVPLPLAHTDVKASVSGYIATVEVTQQFQNPYTSKIEAQYVFPLPENSAVNEFVMIVGERQIRGIIREREEAEKIYQDAREQGYTASLLTQERPNIFTQSVANIEPGKQIDVNIKYYNTLSYADGWFEFVFPMVVGPRFNPSGSTKGVGAVARGREGASGQSTEVSYLKPGERSGHDISLEVDLDAGVAIEEFESPTHRINTTRPEANRLVATLADSDQVPNRDFVLRYRVTGGEIKSGVLTHTTPRGGFFTMMLYPPRQVNALPRQAMEMVFVLDCSGSMFDRPLAQAKEAIRAGLKLLAPKDTFQLISFSMNASKFGNKPLPATRQNIRDALDYLDGLNAESGTMMIEGIKAALDFPHDPQRLRQVCFLTDGYIGNEAEILGAIQKKLGSARIFSFGVGPAVNRYLLDGMARAGRGAVGYFLPETETAPVMENFFERVSHPALADLRIDWAGMQVSDVYPKELPDLYSGRPILVTGKFKGAAPGSVHVTARNGEGEFEITIPVLNERAPAALASIWARSKIADLTMNGGSDREVRKTALDYNLLSQFTAFVAVDGTKQTRGAFAPTVPVAVPVPQGVDFHKTVNE